MGEVGSEYQGGSSGHGYGNPGLLRFPFGIDALYVPVQRDTMRNGKANAIWSEGDHLWCEPGLPRDILASASVYGV
jgi:hypothetical protein